jgi:hypothetical protein
MLSMPNSHNIGLKAPIAIQKMRMDPESGFKEKFGKRSE